MSRERLVNAFTRRRQHAGTQHGPAPAFGSGALLGNGGLGAVVTTRPDAVVLH